MESGNSTRPPAWRSVDVARTCGIASGSAHHLLVRLSHWDLVEAVRSGDTIEVRRQLGRNKTLVASIPDRTLFWSLTKKGKERLNYKGGHAQWCPLCGKARI